MEDLSVRRVGVAECMDIKHGKADLPWLSVSVVPICLVRYT